MATVDLLARVLIGWLVLSVIIGGAYAVVMARHNGRTLRIHGAYPDCIPVRPRITQEQVDETWLSVWPTDVARRDVDELEQSIFDRLFADQIAAEGLQ